MLALYLDDAVKAKEDAYGEIERDFGALSLHVREETRFLVRGQFVRQGGSVNAGDGQSQQAEKKGKSLHGGEGWRENMQEEEY